MSQSNLMEFEKDVLRQRLALLCILTLKDYEERALNYEWN